MTREDSAPFGGVEYSLDELMRFFTKGLNRDRRLVTHAVMIPRVSFVTQRKSSFLCPFKALDGQRKETE